MNCKHNVLKNHCPFCNELIKKVKDDSINPYEYEDNVGNEGTE